MFGKLVKSFSVLALVLAAVAFPTHAFADEDIGQVVDVGKEVAGGVQSLSEDLSKLMVEAKDDAVMDVLVKGLAKVGIDGGWAKQIGTLKQFSGVAKNLLKVINAGENLKTLYDALGDRNAFGEAFADIATNFAASKIADLISTFLKTKGTALVIGSSVIAPGVGTVIAVAGVWAVSWGVNKYVEKKAEELLSGGQIHDAMSEVGKVIWDILHTGPGEDDDGNGQMCKPGDSDPFDSQPESGSGDSSDKKGKFQGLKKLEI